MPHYYLLAVSTRFNLEQCIKYALAGLTNSTNGIWAFVDIRSEDFVSFLYGAKVFHLYKVDWKEALSNAETLPPWPSIFFRRSGTHYYFPFRLHLKPVRFFEESLVRSDFKYVAENLLLRGGYAKTHFQADQTTLQSVSQMGTTLVGEIEPFQVSASAFTPRFTFSRGLVSPPQVFLFQENVLHAVIKRYLSDLTNLKGFLNAFKSNELSPNELEVLGERALPEGHADILVKEAVPIGMARQIVIEVKKSNATLDDVGQVQAYVDEIGVECKAGALIASGFNSKVLGALDEVGLCAFTYSFDSLDLTRVYSFEELCQSFRMNRVK